MLLQLKKHLTYSLKSATLLARPSLRPKAINFAKKHDKGKKKIEGSTLTGAKITGTSTLLAQKKTLPEAVGWRKVMVFQRNSQV